MFARSQFWLRVCCLVLTWAAVTAGFAQEPSLLDQRPFDLITLNEASNFFQLKVQPLPFPGRRKPRNPPPNSTLRVILTAGEPGEYEILWRDIERVELYEELLLKEANRLRDAGQLDAAFAYYHAVRENYPRLRQQAEREINRYLYLDAVQLTRERRFAEAFGVFQELYRRAPQFRLGSSSLSLSDLLGRLSDRVIEGHLERDEFRHARQVLERLQAEYGDDPPGSFDRWIEQLRRIAASHRDAAGRHLDALRYHEAIDALSRMMDVWPEVEGGAELQAQLSRRYPRVAVGVLQPAVLHDAHRIDNWSARRTGRLVHRSLVEFLGAGPEGGQYRFALGMFERSEDRRGLRFSLDRSNRVAGQFTAQDLARRLLRLANPSAVDYRPTWAGLMSSAAAEDLHQVAVDFRRPHVLPEALLGVPLRLAAAADPNAEQQDGLFRVESRDEQQVRFVKRDFQPGDRLAELIERTYDNSQHALAALRRGEIDVVDRIFPADAARLQEDLSVDSPITVQPYALPTVHMLLIKPEHDFLASRDFRRALVFGIDRQSILQRELLGDRDYPGCRVVSGPFPAGISDQDALAYASDTSIAPRRHAHELAAVLLKGAIYHVQQIAESRGEPPPELEPLVLGYPSHESARVAAEAIAADLSQIGLGCQLHEFPPGVFADQAGDCDLVYVEIAIWEPLIDALRLFGADGLAPSDNAYVRRALRLLEQAESWGEVRERLWELHRAVYNELPVIPLWQTVESLAYHRRLQNLEEKPVWLYQHVEQWRIAAASVEQ